MGEREALLRAIGENPDDDTPRLIFADWLQEHGDEDRAVFIRLGCRMRRPGLPDAEFRALSAAAAELCRARGREWRHELPRPVSPLTEIWDPRRFDPPCLQWGEFRRGFVESLELSPDGLRVLVEEQDRVFATTPLRELQAQWMPQFLHFLSDFRKSFRYFHRIEVIVEHLLRSANCQYQIEAYLNYPTPDRLRAVQLIGTPWALARAEQALRPLFGDRLLLTLG